MLRNRWPTSAQSPERLWLVEREVDAKERAMAYHERRREAAEEAAKSFLGKYSPSSSYQDGGIVREATRGTRRATSTVGGGVRKMPPR